GDEHRAAESQPVGAGGCEGQQFARGEQGFRAEDVLLGPCAVEAERLGPLQMGTQAGRVELTVGDDLRDGDRESHPWTVRLDVERVPLPPAAPVDSLPDHLYK